MKHREVEMQQQLEQEREKLQQLQAEKEVAIAAACVRAYDSFEGFESHDEEINNKTSSACYGKWKTTSIESKRCIVPTSPSSF
jgi:hypothetical protein